MKKLMIAAAIVCAAALGQAASVQWKSGDFIALPSCAGAGDFGDKECIMGYVWEFAADPGYTSAADVWDAYQKGELDTANAYSAQVDWFDGTVIVDGGTWKDDDTPVYAAILYLHDDAGNFGKDADYYMANVAQGTATNAGGVVGDLGNMIGGNGEATVWTSTAVPEPTTGLLMLFGLAGLALKRKRA